MPTNVKISIDRNKTSVLTEKRFTPKEAAGVLGRCTKTVLALIASRKISPVFRNAKRGPGAIEIPESALQAYQFATLKGAVRGGR